MPFFSAKKRRDLPIIVGGCHRSGTTLLRRILDSHSRIHCPPEVKFFADLFNDYIHDDLSHVRFFRTSRHMGLKTDQLIDLYGRAFVKSHELAARGQGKKRWADKNPENAIYLEHWSKILDKAFLFVFVVRHPLDTLASLVEARFEKTIPADFSDKVDMVSRYTKLGRQYLESNPSTSIMIRYEDLVDAPAETVEGLMDFLGDPYEAAMLTAFNSKNRQAGIEDPKVKSTAAIHTKSVARWEQDLSSEQVQLVLDRSPELFDWHGYERPLKD